MRVLVDRAICEASAVCQAVAPHLFAVDDSGELTIIDETPAQSDWAAARDAVRSCPTQALSIEDGVGP